VLSKSSSLKPEKIILVTSKGKDTFSLASEFVRGNPPFDISPDLLIGTSINSSWGCYNFDLRD